MAFSVVRRRFEPFVSADKISFPGNGDYGSKRRGLSARLLGGKAERVVQPGPFGSARRREE